MRSRWIGRSEPDTAVRARGDRSERAEAVADLHTSRRHEIEFSIVPSRVLRLLLVVIAVLVALSTATRMIVLHLPDFLAADSIANFLYVDVERSIPTLFSTGVMLVGALLCAAIAHARRRDGGDVRYWVALSVIFGLLALDEFGQMHEKAMDPLRRMLDIEGGPLWFAWVVPAIIALLVFVAFFVRFLGRLPTSTRRGLIAAGVLFVGGALGMEMLGAAYDADHPIVDTTYVAIVTVEETLEMLGMAVLLSTLLRYLPIGLPGARWTLRVAPSEASRGP